MWQHVKLSEQIRPLDTLVCWWDVKQPINKLTPHNTLHKICLHGNLCNIYFWRKVIGHTFLKKKKKKKKPSYAPHGPRGQITVMHLLPLTKVDTLYTPTAYCEACTPHSKLCNMFSSQPFCSYILFSTKMCIINSTHGVKQYYFYSIPFYYNLF